MEKILKRVVKSHKLSHAYLLVGKDLLSAAKKFAQWVNCDKLCGECLSCNKIKKNSHPDVIILSKEGQTSIGIDQIRDLIRTAHLSPLESAKRIYIIDKVEDMSLPASNSFLKILESPPSYLIFILLTRSLVNVLPTIASRCQIVRVKGKSLAQIKEEIGQMGLTCAQEKYLLQLVKLDPQVLDKLTVDNGDKLMEEREVITEKLDLLDGQKLASSFAREESSVKLYEIGIRVFETLFNSSAYQILEMADQLGKMGEERLEFFLKLALGWYRELLFTYLDLGKDSKYLLPDLNNLGLTLEDLKLENLLILISDLSQAPWKLKRHANKKLLLEDLLFKMNCLK